MWICGPSDWIPVSMDEVGDSRNHLVLDAVETLRRPGFAGVEARHLGAGEVPDLHDWGMHQLALDFGRVPAIIVMRS